MCVFVGRLVSGGIPVDHFSHIFVDEAGHAVEPETIISVGGGTLYRITLKTIRPFKRDQSVVAFLYSNHCVGVFRTAECRDRAACFGWRSQAAGTNTEISFCY